MVTRASSQSRDAELLGRFVAAFGTWDELVELHHEVLPELRAPHLPEFPDDYTPWRPIPSKTPSAAADELERFLPGPLPPLFRELVLNYRYLEVDLGRYRLLSNPPSASLHGLKSAMFRDEFLSSVLLRHGFIQFGKGPDVNYDPVCFDTSQRRSRDEMAVVRLDHEEILCYERIVVVERLAASFRELVEETIQRHEQSVGTSPGAPHE
jgi:hypothetical protein